ncbi:MAG: LuxR C-terminal-related transcriptional regulator [Anaerostipes sp.]
MKEFSYIKINGIYQKLRKAESEKRNIYIHAPVAMGKTAAVQYYYRNKSVLWLSGESGVLSAMPEPEDVKMETIIIDDLSWITDESSISYITAILKQEKKHIVLIGRGRLPGWLMNEYTDGSLMQADERELSFGQTQIQRLLKQNGYECEDREAAQILRDTKGFALGIRLLVPNILRAGGYSESVLRDTKLDCFHYYDGTFFERWDTQLQKLLLSIAEYDQFDTELAAFLTTNRQVAALLEYACTVGDFQTCKIEGAYELRPHLKEYLLWKRSVKWTSEEERGLHERAVMYFELKGDIKSALVECEKARNKEKMVELLIENANRHPGIGHFYETRRYYLALPESVISDNPVLMAGMSMLYSLMLQPDESEKWYEKLLDFSKGHTSDIRRTKDAKSRIAYLDIALPHRGIKSITEILKNVAKLCMNRSIAIPEFSVTSNLPSVMNGGKDFCEWSRIDKELARVMGKSVEIVLKDYGVGLVNIALAESAFEKATRDDYEIMTLLSEGYSQAEISGKIEMCFAATGIMVKVHVWHDQMRIAQTQLEHFREKAKKEQAVQLYLNIAVMENWLNLLKGNYEQIRKWLEQTDSEESEGFYILNRYEYLMKVRSYIMLGDYDRAWILSEKLNFYFTNYDRFYMWMENTFLQAIISYRLGRTQWKELFQAAYEKAESYHFPWMIAQEGIAILPLLKTWMKEAEDTGKSQFFKLVYERAKKMAFQYPDYLVKENVLAEPLSEGEKRVLRLHNSGMSTEQILEMCSFTKSTLKFHNSNIYRKLGVKNKADALLAAKQLGLVE